MKIHALTTGAVRVKRSFLYRGHGPRRQLTATMSMGWFTCARGR